MKQIIYTLLLSLISFHTIAQNPLVKGSVSDEKGNPLEGATVQWKNTTIGTIATDGSFELNISESSDTLLVSFIGFNSYADRVVPGQDLKIILTANLELTEFEVKDGRGSNYVSTISTLNVEHIGEDELRKAACCSLAESFETNGTVDVMYTDAVTGTKEVKMLGLGGSYTQLLAEKRPLAKGLASLHLFDYYPGTWVKGIQVSKGIGTVENGMENIAGQINFELAKPWEDDKIFLNTYINSFGRVETNLHLNYPISDKWSMGLLLHGSGNRNQVDTNDDLFLDTPQKTTLNGLYRLFYRGKYLRSQLNVQYIDGQTRSGQVGMDVANPYLVNMDHERLNIFGKIGYVGFDDPNKSIGFIYDFTSQKIDEEYGYLRPRNGTQTYAYTNFMFVSKPGENSKISTGISTNYSDLQNYLGTFTYNVEEKQVGVFFDFSTGFVKSEQVAKNDINTGSACSSEKVASASDKKNEGACCSDKGNKEACCSDKDNKEACCSDKEPSIFLQKLGLITGLRLDQHNLYGLLVSPRLSLKYNFDDRTIARLNIGKGYKTPYILSENIGMLISNTDIMLDEALNVEEAWNMGINFTKEFILNGRSISVNADAYHSVFINKVVMDMERHSHHVHFYNQKGQTKSTYFLIMANVELNNNLRLKGAYKYNHYEVGFRDGNRIPPLFAKNRGLIALEYAVPRTNWDINFSTQFVGKQLFPEHPFIPNTIDLTNHIGNTPSYQLYNIHINKKFTDRFEFYFGGENLGNFTQENPIIDHENPFSDYFNASHIYGPTLGIRGYMGIKWTIK
ncbi:MAG: TonB-dependent receptor [Saprospiraceae bacterium]|nr:TonB-dependent receptor [Saprospiraceae bacterium]